MTPVAKTGLHCGAERLSTIFGQIAAVTPVAKTGLHCGRDFVEGAFEAIRG